MLLSKFESFDEISELISQKPTKVRQVRACVCMSSNWEIKSNFISISV